MIEDKKITPMQVRSSCAAALASVPPAQPHLLCPDHGGRGIHVGPAGALRLRGPHTLESAADRHRHWAYAHHAAQLQVCPGQCNRL